MDMDTSMSMEDGGFDQLQLKSTDTDSTSVQHLPHEHNFLEETIAEPVDNKLHIKGLDSMSTEDVKTYVEQHFNTFPIVRIEWIDDTSANLVFATNGIAKQALYCLSESIPNTQSQPHDLTLRPAKPSHAHHASSIIAIRVASTQDQKQPRAYESSRYYLLNPNADPRNRHQHRGRGARNNRKQNGFDHFDVSMYDDNAKEQNQATEISFSNVRRLRQRNRDSRSRSPDRRRSLSKCGHGSQSGTHCELRESRNHGKELFPARSAASKSRGDHLLQQATGRSNSEDLFPHRVAQRRTNGRLSDISLNTQKSVRSFTSSDGGQHEEMKPPIALLSDRIFTPFKDHAFEQRDTRLGEEKRLRSVTQVHGKELFPHKVNAGKELFLVKTSDKE